MSQRWVSIREVSEIMGVSPATIRSWESRYGWPQPVRTAGLHRRYHRSSLDCFHRVAQLRGRMSTRRAIEFVAESGLEPRQNFPLRLGVQAPATRSRT